MKKQILVVDDDPTILKLLFNSLAKEYLVSTAADGEEAIDKAVETRPDLLITDVVMPKKNGFELCSAFRLNPELLDVPIIVLTALGRSSDKFEGFRMGADEFIVKPFSPSELRKCVSRLLKTSDLTDHSPPSWEAAEELSGRRILTGVKDVDILLGKGLPAASNILFIGPIGSGKSSFCRNFLAEGLRRYESCMLVAIDDETSVVRRELDRLLGVQAPAYHQVSEFLAIVDAFSWCEEVMEVANRPAEESLFKISSLMRLVANAGVRLGQNPVAKKGGRRIVDSISKLLTIFEPAVVERFLRHATRAAATQGGVCTIFVLNKETVQEDDIVNNIVPLMDGVFESRRENGSIFLRVSGIKRLQVPDTWVRL